ncbi:MAG: hypothetical protein IPI81_14420 [Flavobacteriales bacterium]|nr:hypothetical protein [Flavobacteriales bacterium]
MQRILLLTLGFGALPSNAQPLVDLFGVNHLESVGLRRTEVAATLPLRSDTVGRLLVLDPYYVQWNTVTSGGRYSPQQEGDLSENMAGVGSAVTYVTAFGKNWKAAAVGILRYHWLGEQRHGDIQPGGALLAIRTVRPSLILRAGVYVNHDAFGVFVMPLAGIDWRMGTKVRLYGVLPGSLTYEHRINDRFCAGASFRAYTTSFGVRGGDYRRINENPLGLYGDLYILPKLVLRAEGGWCFIRRVLGGPEDPLYANTSTRTRNYADHAIDDGPYIRIVLAFRLRLDDT